MKSIHIYLYVLVCRNCTFRHRYRVCNILHDIALASCLQKSVCHVALSYDTDDILLFITKGKSGVLKYHMSEIQMLDSLTINA